MDEIRTISRGWRFVLGMLFLACGIVPILAAFDLAGFASADIHGPSWLGWVGGGLFVVSGLMIVAGRLPPLLAAVLGLVLMAGLAALANWVAFGLGDRQCEGSASIPFLIEGSLAGLACRIPFAIGALAVDGALIAFAVRTLQMALGGPPQLARWVRVGDGILLLCLAPIILPLVLIVLIGTAVNVVAARIRTGQWPRNEAFIARQLQRRKKKIGE